MLKLFTVGFLYLLLVSCILINCIPTRLHHAMLQNLSIQHLYFNTARSSEFPGMLGSLE